jgi:hypothetical protein
MGPTDLVVKWFGSQPSRVILVLVTIRKTEDNGLR